MKKLQKVTFEDSLDYCNIAPFSVLIKKEHFDRIGGFDEAMEVGEDDDIWLRILKEDRIDLVSQKHVNKYGRTDDQLSMKYKF